MLNVSIGKLDKIYTYYDYCNIEDRYGITFEQFVRKVELGTWEPHLAA